MSKNAGLNGAMKAGEALFRQGFQVDIKRLPVERGQTKADPNSYFLAGHSAEDFHKIPSVPFFDLKLEQVRAQADSVEEQARAISELTHLAAARDPMLSKHYAEKISKAFPDFRRSDIEKKIIRAQRKPPEEVEVKDSKFRPLALVEKILAEDEIIASDNQLYLYQKDHGIYKPWPPEALDKRVIELIGEDVRPYHMDEVKRVLTSSRSVPQESINKPGLLALGNGNLNLETWDLLPFSPEHLITVKSPVIFDPDAKCPQWQKALDEIFPDPPLQILLQQVFGYCFSTWNDLHKAFIFLGEGSNGKGVVTYVLENILGPHNCAYLTLGQFRERFKLEQLRNKYANFAPEASKDELINDVIIKAVTGQDVLTAERKHRDAFHMRVTAKVIVSTNNLPVVNDKSHGWFRRFIILRFTETFEGPKVDPQLRYRLVEQESSGILNWALEGLASLQERGREGFSIPQASIDAMNEYRSEIDPTLDFCKECLTKKTVSDPIPLKDIVTAFAAWALHYQLRPLGRNNLKKSLERTLKTKFTENDNGALVLEGYEKFAGFWR